MTDSLFSKLLAPWQRRAKHGRVFWIVVLVALVGGGVAMLSFGKRPAPVETVSQPPRVRVVKPGASDVPRIVRGNGSIAAQYTLPISPRGDGGTVAAVLVEAGDRVRAGQVLLRFGSTSTKTKVDQSRAALEAAQAQTRLAALKLARGKSLLDEGFLSNADYDALSSDHDVAVARANQAKAQLDQLLVQKGYLNVRAPAAGIILSRKVELGQKVIGGGGPLFQIAKDGAFELRALIPEQDMPLVQVGQKAVVHLVGMAQPINGHVWLVEPMIDTNSRLGLVRILLPQDSVVGVGAFAEAEITVAHLDKPVLPQSAVLSDGKGDFVYILDADNRVRRRSVATLPDNDSQIVIVAGLTGQEPVVLAAGAFLAPGDLVAPVLVRPIPQSTPEMAN